jgi:ACR3 family arsenite efflux pump ArsB
MDRLPKRNYAEMLALLAGIILYCFGPDVIEQLVKEGYVGLKILLFLLIFVMLGDILAMIYWREK